MAEPMTVTAAAPTGKGKQIKFPLTVSYKCKSSDHDIKTYFTVINDAQRPHRELEIVALADGGAELHLVLPARKAYQLGLRPHPTAGIGRISTHGSVPGSKGSLVTLLPAVRVRFHYTCDGGQTEETRETLTLAVCNEAEWKTYTESLEPPTKGAEAIASEAAPERIVLPATPLPGVPDAPTDLPDTPSTPPTSSTIAHVKLSPAYHRSEGDLQQQVVIGHQVLSTLGLNADFRQAILWVEEQAAIEV